VSLDRWLDRLARETRVAAWSVHAVRARSLSLGTKDGQTGNPHAPATVADGFSAGWKIVWADGRVSRIGSDRSAWDSPFETWLEGARAVAHDDPDAASVASPSAMPDLDLFSPDVPPLLAGETDPVARWLDAARRRVAPGAASTWSGSVRATEAESRVVTSRGLDTRSASTAVSWHATFDAEWGCGRASRSLEAFADVESRLDRAIEILRCLREDVRVPSGPLDGALLHPDVVSGWVIPSILHNLSGRAVARGESAFRIGDFRDGAGRYGSALGVEIDPLRPLHPGSYRFSAEGVPAARTVLVEGGRLRTPVLDRKHARRFALPPTAIPLTTDSVVLSGLPRSREESFLSVLDRGILVLRVLGVHTLDPASGDFSLAAPQALAIVSGRPAGRLRVTLAGNLFEALRDPSARLVDFEGEPQPGLFLRCGVEPTLAP
jgi:PmbA protein